MQIGGIWSVLSRSNPLLSRFISVFRPFQSVMKIYPFSFSSPPKSTENLWKIDNFLFARFLPSPFPALFYPLISPFYASKKDLKHFRTLSPYSSLFLPAIFRGIFLLFWLGGDQSVLLPPKTARTSHEIRPDFIRGHFSARVHFRSISNDTRRFPANFRSFLNKKDPKHVSVPWVLNGCFGETLGMFLRGRAQGVQG